MGVSRPSTKQAIASEVWRMLAEFTFTRFQSGDHFGILRELGLTPGHMKALAVLDADEPRPMRAMADALSCDASMVTWLVDRMAGAAVRLPRRARLPTPPSPTPERASSVRWEPRSIGEPRPLPGCHSR